MLSIVSITLLIAVSAGSPCLITTIKVSLKFGALRERYHIRRIWLQFLKALKGEMMQPGSFSDVRRASTCFSFILCLLICISGVTLYRIIKASGARSQLWLRLGEFFPKAVRHNWSDITFSAPWKYLSPVALQSNSTLPMPLVTNSTQRIRHLTTLGLERVGGPPYYRGEGVRLHLTRLKWRIFNT
jgi:hypothetical protein